jgi:hypothetical protein
MLFGAMGNMEESSSDDGMMMLRGAMTAVRETAEEMGAATAEAELIERNSSTGCSLH